MDEIFLIILVPILISISVSLGFLYFAFKIFKGLSFGNSQQSESVQNLNKSVEGNFFAFFPDLAVTFNRTGTYGKTLFLMGFHRIENARTAFDSKKESLLGNPLARAKLESELPGKTGILGAPSAQVELGSANYLKKAKGQIEIHSEKDTVKANFSAGKMEVELNKEKAGLIDFNSGKLIADGKTWSISAMEEKRFYGTILIGYKLERESNIAEIRAFPETDESEFDQLILFSKADLWSISKKEKACILAFSVLAKSQFESLTGA